MIVIKSRVFKSHVEVPNSERYFIVKKPWKVQLEINPSASLSQLEAQTKALMATGKTLSPSSSASRKKDGIVRLSSLKMRRLNRSMKMSKRDSVLMLPESIQDLFLTMKPSSLKFSEDYPKTDSLE